MPKLAEICSRLASDRDARVQEIGRRCLRNYDEFQRLRYAGLTPDDAHHLTVSAETARASGDTKRAKVLDQGAKLLSSEITRLRRPSRTSGATKQAQA